MNEKEIRKLIHENSIYIANKLCDLDHEIVKYFVKTNNYIPPDYAYVDHNAGRNRKLILRWIALAIEAQFADSNCIIITGHDTYKAIALILKGTISKSNIILSGELLSQLIDQEVSDIPVIAIDGLLKDTITRIYIIKQDSIKYYNGNLTLEFSKEHKLGIIKDLHGGVELLLK
ncbi:MAG: hypothetical protein V3V19_11245 [Cocleimonas sp.]